jgi:hypothetical protein
MRSWRLALAATLSASVCWGQPAPAAAQPEASLERWLASLAAIVERGDHAAYRRLVAPSLPAEHADDYAAEMVGGPAERAVAHLRDSSALAAPAGAVRLLLEFFVEEGARARLATVRLDVAPAGDDEWHILEQERLSAIDGLYHLTLNRDRQYRVRDLTVSAEDLTLTMPLGSAFVAEAGGGITAMVLVGQGRMRFSPRPPAERGQVRIFSGREEIDVAFSAAFLRMNPYDFAARVTEASLEEIPVNRRDLQRAQAVFDAEVGKSFGLDLGEVSRRPWWIVPPIGDFLAEVRTRRFSTLTYARSGNEAEDITLFDRQRRRNIAVYASQRTLEARGPFFNEDALVDYDVLDHHVDVVLDPARERVEGRARLRVRVRAFALATLTLRLAESLTVRSVVSEQHGRLLTLRVKNQNSVLVSLPTAVARDGIIVLTVSYGGPLPSQPPEREVIAAGQEGRSPLSLPDAPELRPEPRVLYSNRSYWYPQSTVTDYATALLRITVPDGYDVVASGVPLDGSPLRGGGTPDEPAHLVYAFTVSQPIRYLAVLVSRLTPVATSRIEVPAATTAAPEPAMPLANGPSGNGDGGEPGGATGGGSGQRATGAGVYYRELDLAIVANPRQVSRGRAMMARMEEIFGLYLELLGDAPYPMFTLALVDAELPGGHSPGYLAVLNQPLPTTPYFWRNDPVYFDSFPQFFLAHELAHQFWGQAVGWKSYHEQWISEGFAQYFAVLYAERSRGPTVFRDILRQMRRSAMLRADQGPIRLGYRLGHIRGDSRVFRAIVYNKGAMVLHMLRRLVGDEPFFRALRRFYAESRFRKVGTDDLRRTFEAELGRDFGNFFDRWVLDSALPTVRFRHVVEPAAEGGQQVRLRFEQDEPVFDVPLTVSLRYASGATQELVVPVTEALVERVVPLTGPLAGVEVNHDHAALATVVP